MEDTLVPLDATLFSASLVGAFGIPGYGSTTTAPLRGGPPPPPASVSWAGSLQRQQQLQHSQQQQQAPFAAGAGSKPVARGCWGGAASEELQRRNAQHHHHQQQQQQQQQLPLQQPLPAVQQSAASGLAGLSVGSSGKQHQLLQQQRSSMDSGMAAALQQQRSSFEAAQQRPSFESVVAAAQHRPSFESVVAAAQQRSSFEEGVAAAMQQQQQQQQQQQRSSFEQQRASFEGGVAASNQLFQAQQFMAAQASFQQQHLNNRQQTASIHSFNPFGPLPMHGGPLDFTHQGLLAGCPPPYCMPPPYQQQPVGHGSSTGTTGTDMTEEDDEQGSARTVKRARLVWTPQLHKRFEEAVEKLGHEKAVPKNIMQEMNIEGLTRENVASHLQKWRLLEKKNGRGSAEGRTDASS
mmetsp:Transcript_10957/g.28569  ORF Transcript_10957/g.28569 Transcript_10957/m.28569 type:complete len:408 (-) Transcript_10957:473-1696(-)